MAKKKQNGTEKIRKAAIGIVRWLVIMFVLGMIMNLFGESPDETGGHESLWGTLVFLSHILIGVLLVVGSVIVTVQVQKTRNDVLKKISYSGLACTIAAFLGGVGVVALDGGFMGESASFLMAMGFVGGLVSYLYLFFEVKN